MEGPPSWLVGSAWWWVYARSILSGDRSATSSPCGHCSLFNLIISVPPHRGGKKREEKRETEMTLFAGAAITSITD